MLGVAGTARADVYDDNPAAASRGQGDVSVFARAADGSTLWRALDGESWTAWSSLGGSATSGPAAAAYGSAINVFIRGTDGATYQNTLGDGRWSGWTSLGGYSTSAPAAMRRRGPLDYFDIAVKGGNNEIFLNTYVPGTGWAGWATLGGNLTSAPALNSQGDGIVNVFARGPDCAVWQKSWNGSAWSEWVSLGGCIFGAPAAVSRVAGEVDLYARAGGNAIFQRHFDPAAGWGGWVEVDPAAVESSAGVASDHANRELLFARGGSGLLAKAWNGAAGWTGWNDLGPLAVPTPTPPPPTPPATPPPDGEVALETGLGCTPPNGRLRVSISVRKPKGRNKARVTKIVFFTKGKGRKVRVDTKAPFQVRIQINARAGSTGRVYARVYYKRSAHGKLHRKVVSRRYTVCR
jgi:hypothetical protein